jgi:hypothetical protein
MKRSALLGRIGLGADVLETERLVVPRNMPPRAFERPRRREREMVRPWKLNQSGARNARGQFAAAFDTNQSGILHSTKVPTLVAHRTDDNLFRSASARGQGPGPHRRRLRHAYPTQTAEPKNSQSGCTDTTGIGLTPESNYKPQPADLVSPRTTSLASTSSVARWQGVRFRVAGAIESWRKRRSLGPGQA